MAEGFAVRPVRGEIAEHDVVQRPKVRKLRPHRVDGSRIFRDEGVFQQARQPQAAYGDAPTAEGAVTEFVVDYAAVEHQQVACPHLIGIVANEEAGAALVDEQRLHKVRVGMEQAGVWPTAWEAGG